MNSKNITPLSIKDKCICYKCLKNTKELSAIHIPDLEYPSNFNGLGVSMYLCDDCLSKTNEEWWKLKEMSISDADESGYEYTESKYEYDDEMYEYLKALPVQTQEVIFNRNDFINEKMDPQDWIDWKLGELSEEKYKEYGFVSPKIMESYKERFPTCHYPVRKVYSDGSAGCYCFAGASGLADQSTDINISKECHECLYYKKRTNGMIEIKAEDWDDYLTYIKYTLNKEKLKEKFSDLIL